MIGERSSGTNHVHVLCKRNLNLEETSDLGWKHGFPSMIAIPKDVLVIASIRNALDWALSMHAKPWHASPDLQRLSFSDFIRAPWDSRVDRHDYFGLHKSDARVGGTLIADRHPLTGEMFPNIFAMRTAKLTALLGFANWECNFAMVRLEDVSSNPETLVATLADRWPLTQASEFRKVHRRLGSRFKGQVKARPTTPAIISASDMRFILEQLDSDLEARLGYSY